MPETILIVDDSLTVRMDLLEAFEAAGFRVIPCATAAGARTALAGASVHMIVLDVVLPDADGIELLKEFRTALVDRAPLIVMLSSEAEIKDRIRGLQTGADEYVGKPYDVSYLVAKAQELLRTRHSDVPDAAAPVVLIDDSATFREELRATLDRAGYRVLTASTGEDGLRLAAAQRPAAILVDGVLPGIDGPTVIRRVRLDAALRDVPCIMLTASEDSGAELRALEAGADTFARKSEDLAVVLAKLAAVLRRTDASAAPDPARSALGPKKILAVDSSPSFLQELANALKTDGYEIIPARSGSEALELLSVEAVDCILIDVALPGLSGQDTCRRIKSAAGVRDIPLIMLTAVADRSGMIDGLSAGADDFISKSSDIDVLRARVRAQIRRRQFEDEGRRVREQLLRKRLEAAEAKAARELAETRAALVEELERKNRELEAFSYSVSHDLRAPLRSIDGFSQALLEDYADQLDAKGQDYLRRVRGAALRMGELIDDLLKLSRVGRTELNRRPTSLVRIAHEIIADLQRKDEPRAVEFAAPGDLVADADARLIRVALENLLGNAWKFTAKTPNPRIELGLDETNGERVYYVRDNGAGFDMAYADKLFRPFQRLHGVGDFPGTGIGLATVYRIVDKHGGRIWADATPSAGATFYFTLPPVRFGGAST